MRKIFFLVLFFVVAAMATPVSENGALSFNSEGRIVNEKGQVVQLRGMSLFWDQWASGWFNENVIKGLASTDGSTGWSASVIRAPLSQLNVSQAQNMIDWAAAAGIYIIIDFHSHCAHKATDRSSNFFREVSAYVKQKSYKHVIYELYNEPLYENCWGETDTQSGGTKTSWSIIKTYALSVIPGIRANDPNGLILVGTPQYSQDVFSAQKDPITGYNNIGYVLHFYASESGHSGLKTELLRARCQNFPVFITEWGTSPAIGNGSINWTWVNEWMAWIEKLGYSWANWSLYDKDETASAISPRVGSSGYWSDGQLTQSGQYVRKMIRGFSSGGTLATMGLSEPSMQSCSIFEGGEVFEFERTGWGEFGPAINAENYADSSNIQSVEDKSIHASQDIYIKTTGDNAWAKYEMRNVPADGYYRMVFVYQAPNKELKIPYTVEGVDGTSYITLPQTTDNTMFSTSRAPIQLKSGTDYITFDLGGVTSNDLKFDAFWAKTMDSTDSVNFGLLEVDENGNRIVKDPESSSSGMPESSATEAIAPVRSSLVQLQLQGRTLSLAGVEGDIALNIMDLQGRVMLTKRVRSGQVDLSNLRSGSYVLRATARGAVVNQRINLK